MNREIKTVLLPHRQKPNLWIWKVKEKTEDADWIVIDGGLEINYDIAAMKAKKVIENIDKLSSR